MTESIELTSRQQELALAITAVAQGFAVSDVMAAMLSVAATNLVAVGETHPDIAITSAERFSDLLCDTVTAILSGDEPAIFIEDTRS